MARFIPRYLCPIKFITMGYDNHKGALQSPIGSGFNASSTATAAIQGIDLHGKWALVTGGSTGIGLETVKTLARAGASVVVPARNMEKARKNLGEIANVHLEAMDLLDPGSIAAFTERFLANDRPLHLLINNAGIMWVPLRRDQRGIESQLAVNYLAVFQLTAGLWPALKRAAGARIVNVSSLGHQFAPFDFGDPNFLQRPYGTLEAYGQSKTAVNLFSMALDQRTKAHGVRAYALHPGNIAGTELGREASLESFQKIGLVDGEGNILPEVAATLKSVPQGAATTIWCATSPLLDSIGGVYCEDCDIAAPAYEPVNSAGVRPYSLDRDSAERLWSWSQETTGIGFQVE